MESNKLVTETLTREEVLAYRKLHEKIENRLEEVLPIYCKLNNIELKGAIQEFDVQECAVEVTTLDTEDRKTDFHFYTIPLKYFNKGEI